MTASFGYWAGVATDLAAVLAIVTGAVAGLTVLARFSARFSLRILPRWKGDTLILRLEVENTSRIRAGRPHVDLQILEYTLEEGDSPLSEWVPFAKEDIDPREEPLEWREPVRVFVSPVPTSDTTDRVYPGEVLVAERLYDYPGDVVLHIGLRVRLLGWPGDATAGEHDETARPRHSQVTTRFVVKRANA
ncbi:MAG TPA: hypothetical protein VIM05_07065 [Gaiellaceae bacterium]|jgi:hypothetical protein